MLYYALRHMPHFSLPKTLKIFVILPLLTLSLSPAVMGSGMKSPSQMSTETQTLRFPSNFKWCVATSAYQIEGHNMNNNWTRWEKAGRVFDKEVSGEATDHWNRVEEDVGLMKHLGVTLYRMSVEWSRIEPREGEFDEEAIAHYRNEINLLHQAGIEPAITLLHFTIPQWLEDRGAWEWDGFAQVFARFATVVRERIGPDVRDWYTLNEPMVVLGGGYLTGELPPGRIRPLQDMKPLIKNMLKVHSAGYHALHDQAKASGTEVRVGAAFHLRDIQPANGLNPLDRIITAAWDRITNWASLDALDQGLAKIHVPFQLDLEEEIADLANTQDFIGMNYYSGDRIFFNVLKNDIDFKPIPDTYKSDIGWEAHPKGFSSLLKNVAKRYPGKPIVISENGIADARDFMREKYLRSYLASMHEAIQDGVPVEGYCHWSLLDNFEWREGYHAKFGLYEVDLATQKRTLRKSGEAFREIVLNNGFNWNPKELKVAPVEPKRELLPVGSTPWPLEAKVFSNVDSSCRMAVHEFKDEQGEMVTDIYVAGETFVSNPAEGVIRIRNRDGMIVKGPSNCSNMTPWTKVETSLLGDGVVLKRVKCGGLFDALHVNLEIEARNSSVKGPFPGDKYSVLTYRYVETSRSNDNKRFFKDYRPEEAPISTLNDIECRALIERAQ